MRSPGGRGFFRSVALAFAASAAAAAAAAARHATAAAVVDAIKMKDWHEFLCMHIVGAHIRPTKCRTFFDWSE